MTVLTGVRWNLSVVLICISFMARDGKHFFMCFFAIWISSFEKVLFSSVAHFLIGSLILGEFSFLSSLYILVISPLSDWNVIHDIVHCYSSFVLYLLVFSLNVLFRDLDRAVMCYYFVGSMVLLFQRSLGYTISHLECCVYNFDWLHQVAEVWKTSSLRRQRFQEE
jgi:hypothetical protein